MSESLKRTFIARDRRLELGEKTLIMGIINVTPDSFSDGGEVAQTEQAIARGLEFDRLGVDIIDIGGESTRPFSEPIDVSEEKRRVVPVIEALSGKVSSLISVDTYKTEVAEKALQAGAHIVNDISAGNFDPDMSSVVKKHNAGVVLMHIKGTPKNMQVDPKYKDLFGEIRAYLKDAVNRFRECGVAEYSILVDPGIGFGKNLQHNLELMRNLSILQGIGIGVLVGPSRKSFIGTITGKDVKDRLQGTVASVCACAIYGADVVRVHDVEDVKIALSVVDKIKTQKDINSL